MNIALVAHDNKKTLMENLCIAYRHILVKHELYATGTTGLLIEETSNLPVHKYLGSVLRLCDIHNIPLASNLATAEALLLALDRGDLDWRHIVRES